MAAFLFSCSPDLDREVKEAYDQLPGALDYNIHVKPILSDKCFSCHGPDKAKQEAGLRLDIEAVALAPLPEHPDKVAIDPGNLEGSELFHRITSSDPEYRMPAPSSHLTLSHYEKAVLIKWIEDGAVYKPHWSFTKPVKPSIPFRGNEQWTAYNPIDNFILERIKEERLTPSATAGKEVLLRRVFLDLTGLPPTIDEMNEFLNDNSPNAYEKQVDKLLSSPHYGEKMAVDWLDVARYADSHGYTVDRLRDMSPYRDWVINAFNTNLSYDRFIQYQLAGDLMPQPTRDMLIATAFNRNHPQNMEGGIIEKEFQTEYVVDRTNTFGNAFIGLTVGCAKCHDHKFDPFTQKNYYELFSFFNNVKEAGQISWDNALPTPTMMLPTKEKEKLLQFISANINEQQKKIDQLSVSAEDNFQNWLNKGEYKKLAKEKLPAVGLQASYSLENASLANKINASLNGVMKREIGQPGDAPVFTAGRDGKGLLLNGDTWLDLKSVGVFNRSQPFTIGIWINIPADLNEGVILHKSQAERLYNFRGYHLYLKDNRLELNMAHTSPSNAITKASTGTIPRNKWIHLTITYDGSSRASGLNLFLDGDPMSMETTMDQLTKDILFKDKIQPGLQVGAWWRGLGFKGGKVDEILVYNRLLTPFEIQVIAKKASWFDGADKKKEMLTTAEVKALKDYYLLVCDKPVKKAGEELQQLRSRLSDSTENIDELMVMQESPTPQRTHVLLRGNYDAPGEEVSPNTPSSILSFPQNLPKNRYGLAQWVTNADHPLTARVAVNRLWQNFFGTGIVKTSEDFGNQGEMPSHLKLLDWLAITFIESGWDIKKMNKLIVMSATYRQSSSTSTTLREKDPENRLLARGPANRLPAEMIRDNALMASGLINNKIGGRSIHPYQPGGLWEINNTSYTQDTGNAVYRRSLYVILKRSVPNPTLATFDAGSRSFCVTRRQQTNTPLQALVTLNDPTFIEAAKVLGEQMSSQKDVQAAIIIAYRKLTGQTPGPKVIKLLLELQQAQLKKFREHPSKAAGWLNAGQYKINTDTDVSNMAANAVVASTIMNSDASLTKR